MNPGGGELSGRGHVRVETHVSEEEPELGHSVERTFQAEGGEDAGPGGVAKPPLELQGTERWVVSTAVGVPP